MTRHPRDRQPWLGREKLMAGQLPAPPPAISPPSRSSLREAHCRLAELLHTVASILGDIHREEAAAGVEDAARRATDSRAIAPMTSVRHEVHPGAHVTSGPGGRQPDGAASSAGRRTLEEDILPAISNAIPTKSEATTLPGGRLPPFHQRLPALK
ncbi:unnamed protein product [Lampetra planeri]